MKYGTLMSPGITTEQLLPFLSSPETAAEICESLSPELTNRILSILPGFCDVHVHFREPGFSEKETIHTGSVAAASAGYTDVCTMPNLSPVPDTLSSIRIEVELIRRDAVIGVHPYASISIGEKGISCVDFESLKEIAIAFSDDGHGIQDDSVMREAMLRAKACGKLIVAHCEDNSLVNGGVIHAGDYARSHHYPGISSESEWKPLERDLKLAEETGCAYHACHLSTKESIDLIRQAKKQGLDVTCETAPHYLLLDESCLEEHGRFKMNPPLRSEKDREAVLEGILDGTIDMVATDHAPHTASEKSRGLSRSPFGITGIETAFPLLYTFLVKEKILSLEDLIRLLSIAPRKRFSIPLGKSFSIWDLEESYPIIPSKFHSLGHSTPFEGWQVNGRCLLTVRNGVVVYRYQK